VKTISTNRKGTPDVLACVNGRFVALEVKTPTGRVDPLQTYQLDCITAAGGVAHVVRSVDDVKKILEQL